MTICSFCNCVGHNKTRCYLSEISMCLIDDPDPIEPLVEDQVFHPADGHTTDRVPPSPELAEIILKRDRVQERVRGLIIERDRARADLTRLKEQGIVKQAQYDNLRPPHLGLTTNELEVERIRVRNCVLAWSW